MPEVKPVPQAHIDAVLECVNKQIGAMIRLQLLTGMRPGEVTIMRGGDLDTSGRIWVYRPASHKTEHHYVERLIYLGPKAQEVLRPFLKRDLQAYLFSPAEAECDRRQALHAGRKTPMSCGNRPGSNRRPRPNRKPGARYTRTNYRGAIRRACEQAFPPPGRLARREQETIKDWKVRLTDSDRRELREWRREHSWHPHQIRHNAATRLREEFGIEAARVVLGHRSAGVTEIYAEIDHLRAADVMARVG
jgi:integrase